MFKGEEIIIPPKGHILMDASEAALFNGQFIAPKSDDSGQLITSKPLRVELLPLEDDGKSTFICVLCARPYESPEVLEAHVRTAHPSAVPLPEKKKEDKK